MCLEQCVVTVDKCGESCLVGCMWHVKWYKAEVSWKYLGGTVKAIDPARAYDGTRLSTKSGVPAGSSLVQEDGMKCPVFQTRIMPRKEELGRQRERHKTLGLNFIIFMLLVSCTCQ
jgi:hypothetical protein